MLKERDLNECGILYELMTDSKVFPFVRQKAYSYEEFIQITRQNIEDEALGKMISRTILNEQGFPIGTISLFDIDKGKGFLGTWIGTDYQGKGYNQKAKGIFFSELFFSKNIETVFLKIRKHNIRSVKAAEKLPYVKKYSHIYQELYNELNKDEPMFELYSVEKIDYLVFLNSMNAIQSNYEVYKDGL